ncbi:MAG: hypothetical protein HY909_11160 [Deltaproteobacteria bacterium]|nr:hypothetical protein [Deltaproteobacteria bacterium]
MSTPPEEPLEDAIRRVWPAARARWSSFVLLGDPVVREGLPAVAQIDLGTRVVSVDGPTMERLGLRGRLEAILAHEVGHHVRYPGTLATQARLRLLERSLIPFEEYSLLNTFTDLLINERLGAELSEDLAAVYRAFTEDLHWKTDPSFLFYLTVYEELWRLPPGALLGPHTEAFHRAYPAHRADAQLLAQDLFALGPNLYTQYLFFASVLVRYLQPLEGAEPKAAGPGRCATGEPSPEDWADALTQGASEEEALERALREGWLSRKDADRLKDRGLEHRIGGLPGTRDRDLVQVTRVMASYYRQQAERLLFRPPAQRRMGEAVVPTTTTPWEPGDPVTAIDWRATLSLFGPDLGPATPVLREQVADPEGLEVSTWQPRMELYLDTSGSMPNPIFAVNAMTLAAVVLAVAAVRAGGEVRALVYSVGTTRLWDWNRSEQQLTAFLMHYIGGGTQFPFEVLDQSVDQCRDRQPIRVAITDRDFDANIDAKPACADIFARAAATPPGLVMLLHRPLEERVARYRKAGAGVVPVENLTDFPRMAARLAEALFPAGGRACR